ncbi:hypothetical protein QTP88_020422 [Uroleucon formosanum]
MYVISYVYNLSILQSKLGLNGDERIDALKFIYNLGVQIKLDVMDDLSNFQSKQGHFAKKCICENSLMTEPVKWWKFLEHISPLSKVAVRILTAPCTSAAIEQKCSTFSSQQKISRLTTEKAVNNCRDSTVVIQKIQNSSSSFNSDNNDEHIVISESDLDSDNDSDSHTSILYNDTSSDETSVLFSDKEDEDN